MPRSRFVCRWNECGTQHPNAGALQIHISEAHVGRRATNNLCLQCQWRGCGVKAAKRDHLISHLRVHVPLKPYRCAICRKAFKRPQDLKKHERIHTPEHKASLMSNQPGYKVVRRRRRPATGNTSPQTVTRSISLAPAGTASSDRDTTSVKLGTARHDCSFWHQNATDSDGSISSASTSETTPPNRNASRKDNHPTEFTRVSTSSFVSDPLNEFFNDVLTQGDLAPEYNSAMMDRLNSLTAIVQQQPAGWVAPLDDAYNLNTLQHWLEQLSANIQTNTCIYPNIISPSMLAYSGDDTVDPNRVTMDPASVDQVLYPTTHSNDGGAWTQASCTYNPVQLQHSDSSSSPIYDTVTPSSLEQISNRFEASFWTPGNSTEVTFESIDGPTPSEAIDFSLSVRGESPPLHLSHGQSVQEQPIHAFETSKQDVGTPKPVKQTWTYKEKRDMISMVNAMQAPSVVFLDANIDSNADWASETQSDTCSQSSESTDATEASKASESAEPTAALEEPDNVEKARPQRQQTTVKTPKTTNPRVKTAHWNKVEACFVDPVKNSPETKETGSDASSPYKDLNAMLQNLTINENETSNVSEEDIKKMHAKTVDLLWDAVYRAQKHCKKRAARPIIPQQSTHITHTAHMPLTA